MAVGRTRRIAAAILLLPVAMACRGSAAPTEPGPDRGPDHVLVITVDTLRWDYLSSNGYPLPTTPFIDGLLSEGYVFDGAVTPIARTSPALASLWSGLYPQRHGLRRLFDSISPDVPLLAESAQRAGYRTIAVVSNHILTPDRGLLRGWDVYDCADDAREAEQTTDDAIAHLSEIGRNDRVLAWVHYIDPHVPYYPPRKWVDTFTAGYQGPYAHNFGQIKGGLGDEAYPADLPKAEAVFHNPLPPEVNAHVRKLYAADIRAADDAIGRLVRWVRTHLGPDWMIVFSADHGESLGEHDYFYDHGDYVYNAGLHVPLGIVLPEGHPLRGTGRIHDWVSLVDVAPTLAELLRLDWPPPGKPALDGRSLGGYLRGQPPSPEPVFAECGWSFFPDDVRRRKRFDETGRFRAVIYGRTKLIWTPFQTGSAAYELYDLVDDPHETRDLYDEREFEDIEPLWGLLKAWFHEQPVESSLPSEEDLRTLRSLGYVD